MNPTGVAATLGESRSADAGATWSAGDAGSNFPMTIRGTPSPVPELEGLALLGLVAIGCVQYRRRQRTINLKWEGTR